MKTTQTISFDRCSSSSSSASCLTLLPLSSCLILNIFSSSCYNSCSSSFFLLSRASYIPPISRSISLSSFSSFS